MAFFILSQTERRVSAGVSLTSPASSDLNIQNNIYQFPLEKVAPEQMPIYPFIHKAITLRGRVVKLFTCWLLLLDKRHEGVGHEQEGGDDHSLVDIHYEPAASVVAHGRGSCRQLCTF